jgi:hypothetical protein
MVCDRRLNSRHILGANTLELSTFLLYWHVHIQLKVTFLLIQYDSLKKKRLVLGIYLFPHFNRCLGLTPCTLAK